MKVEVTQEDIEKGLRFSIHKCPLARAIRRKFPNSDVEVTNWRIEIDGKYYGINKQIVRFIDDFDCGKSVKPKCFIIEPAN